MPSERMRNSVGDEALLAVPSSCREQNLTFSVGRSPALFPQVHTSAGFEDHTLQIASDCPPCRSRY